MDLKPFFDQYLRDIRIPVFENQIKDGELTFRWNNCVQGFNMSLKIFASGEEIILKPTARFNTVKLPAGTQAITVDPNFYVAVLNMAGKQKAAGSRWKDIKDIIFCKQGVLNFLVV